MSFLQINNVAKLSFNFNSNLKAELPFFWLYPASPIPSNHNSILKGTMENESGQN